MKIINTTNDLRTTWGNQDVQPGDVFDASKLPDDELWWLLRHGFKKVEKPKKARSTTDADTQPPFGDGADCLYDAASDGKQEVVAEIPAVRRKRRRSRKS